MYFIFIKYIKRNLLDTFPEFYLFWALVVLTGEEQRHPHKIKTKPLIQNLRQGSLEENIEICPGNLSLIYSMVTEKSMLKK